MHHGLPLLGESGVSSTAVPWGSTGRVRTFRETDLGSVVRIHMRTERGHDFPEALGAYFRKVFLENPWYAEDTSSVVYEWDREVVGFIGIVPRPMSIDGRPVQATVFTHLMVDPAHRRGWAAIELLREVQRRSHDLCLSDDANNIARRLWESLGGGTAFIYSLTWTIALRPVTYVFQQATRERLPSWLGTGMSPLLSIGDALALRAMPQRFSPRQPALTEEELSCEALLELVDQFATSYSLRPKYDLASLKWVLQTAAQNTYEGNIRQVLLRTQGGDVVGWYIYYSNPGKTGRVLQMVARNHASQPVLDHLLYTAWQEGMTALSGRFAPHFAEALQQRHCIVRLGTWMLIQSRNPELLGKVCLGDAFLSDLEGEWPTRFPLPWAR